jgi:hypothetical protein
MAEFHVSISSGAVVDSPVQGYFVAYNHSGHLNVIGDLAFGEPFGCFALGAFHSWVALIYETVKVGTIEGFY